MPINDTWLNTLNIMHAKFNIKANIHSIHKIMLYSTSLTTKKINTLESESGSYRGAVVCCIW